MKDGATLLASTTGGALLVLVGAYIFGRMLLVVHRDGPPLNWIAVAVQYGAGLAAMALASAWLGWFG